MVYKERFQKQYLFYEHYLHVFQVNIQSEHLHTGFQQKKKKRKEKDTRQIARFTKSDLKSNTFSTNINVDALLHVSQVCIQSVHLYIQVF